MQPQLNSGRDKHSPLFILEEGELEILVNNIHVHHKPLLHVSHCSRKIYVNHVYLHAFTSPAILSYREKLCVPSAGEDT